MRHDLHRRRDAFPKGLFGSLNISSELLQIITVPVFFFLVLWRGEDAWVTATLLVFVVLIHELGHAVVLKWFGVSYFGPFFILDQGGGVVPTQVLNRGEIGWFILGGPIIGILGCATLAGLLYFFEMSEVSSKFVQLTLVINTFNLLPVYPLDGGRLLRNVLPADNRMASTGLIISLLTVLLFAHQADFANWILGLLLCFGFVFIAASVWAPFWQDYQEPEFSARSVNTRTSYYRKEKQRQREQRFSDWQQAWFTFAVGMILMIGLFWSGFAFPKSF